ncbi:MAG: RNA methyltransferase [Candidatus Omnitrophica bacterium]|nr:RNA methyltransferase [Candidatus Omnitrophota bacterium]
MINKTTNNYLKEIKDLLKDPLIRKEKGLFIVEGAKLVNDFIFKGHEVSSMLISNNFLLKTDNIDKVDDYIERGFEIYKCSKSDFDKASTLKNPEGILAVFTREEIFPLIKEKICDKFSAVICDKVQDPGNLGAIIRNSVAFGYDGVVLLGETADLYNPKVIRSSAGTILDIPVYSLQYSEVAKLKDYGIKIYASDSSGMDCEGINKIITVEPKFCVVFGSEGQGLSDEIFQEAYKRIYIPIDGVESLNVASTSAIMLYELSSIKLGRAA